MAIEILHIAFPNRPFTGLAGAAQSIYSLLAIPEFEERDSSNYKGGGYFSASHGDASYEVSLEDDPAFADYEVSLTIRTAARSAVPVAPLVLRAVEQLLHGEGKVSTEDRTAVDAHQIVKTVYSLKHGTPPTVERRSETVTLPRKA